MKSIIKKLPKSQIEAEIEVSDQEFNAFIEKAVLKLGEQLKIEGFRPGKAPKEIIEQKVGKERILAEAADMAVNESYKKFLIENNIDVVSHPEVEIIKLAVGSPFIFKARAAVLPEIELPDYKKIASKMTKGKIVVNDEEVGEALKWLQKSRAKFILKNEPAQTGDFVEIEFWASGIDGIPPASQKDTFVLGEGRLIPGFEDALKGMKAGEEKKEISLSWPESHHLKNLSGKTARFRIQMKSVQKVELSELNDQFAKSLGTFNDLQGLKQGITKNIESEKNSVESQRIRKEILTQISQCIDCELPEVAIEEEKKRMLETLKKNVAEQIKISFEDYLSKIKKTEKDLLDSFLPGARQKIKEMMIIKEIIKKEKIEATDKEVEEEISGALKQYSDISRAKKEIDLERLREYTREAIKNEKVFQKLELLAKPV